MVQMMALTDPEIEKILQPFRQQVKEQVTNYPSLITGFFCFFQISQHGLVYI